MEISQGLGVRKKLRLVLEYNLSPINYILVEGSLDGFGGAPPTLDKLAEYISRNVGIPTECIETEVTTLAKKFAGRLATQGANTNESRQYEWLRKTLRNEKMRDKPPERAARTDYSIYTFYAFIPVLNDEHSTQNTSQTKELTNVGDVSGIKIPRMGFIEIPKSTIAHKYTKGRTGFLFDALDELLSLYSRVNTGEGTLTVNIFDKNLSHLDSFLIQNNANCYNR